LPKTPKWLINPSSFVLLLWVCFMGQRIYRTDEEEARGDKTKYIGISPKGYCFEMAKESSAARHQVGC
jgi:hypothetical protein